MQPSGLDAFAICQRRLPDGCHFLEMLDELHRLGIKFVSFRGPIDTRGPLRRAMLVIVGAIADGVAPNHRRESPGFGTLAGLLPTQARPCLRRSIGAHRPAGAMKMRR